MTEDPKLWARATEHRMCCCDRSQKSKASEAIWTRNIQTSLTGEKKTRSLTQTTRQRHKLEKNECSYKDLVLEKNRTGVLTLAARALG